MKYEIGDKIILLHSDEEGTVVEFINDKMVMVNVEGVKFPVYMDQIDFPYFKIFSTARKEESKKLFVDDIRKEKQKVTLPSNEGVFLSFFPVFNKDVFNDDNVDKMKIFLVNSNADNYNFIYNLNYAGENKFSLKNTIRSASDFYIHDISFEDMSDNPKFSFEFSLVTSDKKKADFFEAGLKVKAKQLFKKIEESRIKNDASFSFQVFQEYPEKLHEERVDLSALSKGGSYDIKKASRHLPPPQSVVDLHFDKIANDTNGLSSFQMLDMQLATFEKYLDLARAHRLPEMIVIHGIGEGRLRDEIHERLRLSKGIKSFVNQFHPLYGFGATEIYLSY